MEGSLDQTKFEDDCRDMFGVSSYILFTIDKLIFQLAKQVRRFAIYCRLKLTTCLASDPPL